MPDKNTVTGIEFNRAKFAYDCAENAKINNRSEYRAYAKKLPMLIKTNGLAATLAFMFSKYNGAKPPADQDDYIIIGEDICRWLQTDPKLANIFNPEGDFRTLTELVTTLNSSEYRAVTNEVMAFLGWLRRYADGLMREDD